MTRHELNCNGSCGNYADIGNWYTIDDQELEEIGFYITPNGDLACLRCCQGASADEYEQETENE